MGKMKHIMVVMLLALTTLGQAKDVLLEQYIVSRLDLTSGLPHNNVNQIFVDSQGFMWISCYGGGAVRYDGYGYMSPLFLATNGDISNSCKGFAEDGFQRLWIAYDESTVVMDMRTMSSTKPRWEGGDMMRLLRRESVKVYCDAHKAIWQVTRDSVFRYTFHPDGSIKHVSRCHYIGNTPDICIADIEQNGTVWINVDNGLCRLTEAGDRLERQEIAPAMQQLRGLYVTDMLKQGSMVWIATNLGLHAYDLYSSKLTSYRHTTDENSLPHDFATSLALMSDGRLLVGTLRGVCVLNQQTATFSHWNSSTAECPLPSDFVHCLLNYGSQLWIGTETAGIVKLSPKPLMLRNYVNDPSRPGSLSPHPVNAIYVEPNGTLWTGTVEGGLNRKMAGDDFEHWTTANSALSHNSVSALEPDKYGHLWIGTWGGGVNVITMDGKRTITHVDMPAEMVTQTNYIGSLAYDKYNDALWIGSNDGIFLYDFHTGRLEDPFKENRVVRGCIGAQVDKDGQLWMGCLAGVCIIDIKSGRGKDGLFRCRRLRQKLDYPQSPVVDKIACICEAKDGTLWLGSNGYGLYRRVKGENGEETFQVLTTDDGLANNSVKGIVEDARGHLWITTNNGLSIYDPSQHSFINYGENEGLLCQQFYWNSAVKGPDGAIYLGSLRGLTEIRGENTDAKFPVRLTFTRLMVDNQEITAANSDLIDADVSRATSVRLHESNKSFVISFSTLTYAGEVQGRYSYRMRGFEDEWIPLKPGEHSVRYTSLKPGSYTFEVQYTSDLDNNDNHVISIAVEVAPYFWKSWWFVLLMALLLAAIGFWLFRLRLESWRTQEAEKLLLPIRKALDDSDAPELLQSRIQNIIENNERVKKSLNRSVEADRQDAAQKNKKPFMERATEILEQNYMNSEFGITEFADAIGMSKSLLSKRLNAEAGQSTGQFIRNYRLSIAKKLILENLANRNITEIAYKVGFNDPKYFTRCFTRQYGKSPSTYVEEDSIGG